MAGPGPLVLTALEVDQGGEMNYADPWDEIARLEEQMEVELLAQLEAAPSPVREPAEQSLVPEPAE